MAEERREVIWTTSARHKLDDIVAYIARDAPLAALAFLEEVLATADTLEEENGVRKHCLAGMPRARSWQVSCRVLGRRIRGHRNAGTRLCES
ncbi:MAG: type II toxin-antitoxin system RelE/ParE family toxin, partial [Nitrospira sp.]|nr:type II toxin-antitoxin system RelE/ParE family toxin [Nitrospira sp.]